MNTLLETNTPVNGKVPVRPEVLGRRLVQARKAQKLTQDAVAQYLDISRPTFIALEKGTRIIRPEELIRLAELYRVPVHSLVQSGAEEEVETTFLPRFRETNSALASNNPPESVQDGIREAVVRQFEALCADYAHLEAINRSFAPRFVLPPVYDIKGLTIRAAAEEVAQAERTRLGMGGSPISNLLTLLEERVGLRIFVAPPSIESLPFTENREQKTVKANAFHIAGVFAYNERYGGCIWVNGTHPLTRQTWTLAHEYAHFLAHRNHAEITVLTTEGRKPVAEQFADAFAASFLMPAAALRSDFRSVLQRQGDLTVANVVDLAERYGVSPEAMVLRLEALNCLRVGAWDRLSDSVTSHQRKKTVRGDRESDPVSRKTTGQFRLPPRYRRLAVQAAEEGEITESALIRYLRVNSRLEAREVVRAMTESVTVSDSGEERYTVLPLAERFEIDERETPRDAVMAA